MTSRLLDQKRGVRTRREPDQPDSIGEIFRHLQRACSDRPGAAEQDHALHRASSLKESSLRQKELSGLWLLRQPAGVGKPVVMSETSAMPPGAVRGPVVMASEKQPAADLSRAPDACPLCGADRPLPLERVRIPDLEHEYRRQQSISVVDQFPAGINHVDLVRCRCCGLECFHPLVTGTADFYARLSRAETYYSSTRWEFRETLRRLCGEPDLIDVGCGDGIFLKLVPGQRHRGIEFNPEAARRARDAGLTVSEVPIEQLPEARADVVTLFQVLEHVLNPVEILGAVTRILRPGGRLFVAVPNNDSWVGRAPPNPLNAPPHHPLRWRAEALRYIPRLVPLVMDELLEEPLAPEHLHAYRRSQFMESMGRKLGWNTPRYGLSPAAVGLRKLATLWTEISLRIAPSGPTVPGTGHSLLAIYTRPAAATVPEKRSRCAMA
jgi:SAM-dependent methyltransferase